MDQKDLPQFLLPDYFANMFMNQKQATELNRHFCRCEQFHSFLRNSYIFLLFTSTLTTTAAETPVTAKKLSCTLTCNLAGHL